VLLAQLPSSSVARWVGTAGAAFTAELYGGGVRGGTFMRAAPECERATIVLTELGGVADRSSL